MAVEQAAWKKEVQGFLPKWGTNEPITLREMVYALLYDANGRSLTEIPPNTARVPMDMQSVRTTGKREQTKQNFSAYDQVVSTYHDSLGIISYFRNQVHPYEFKPSPERILETAHTVIGFPRYEIFRAPTPQKDPLQNGDIPIDVSGAVKIMLGAQIPYDIWRHGGVDRFTGEAYPHPTRSQLTEMKPYVDYVIDNGLLVSQSRPDVACPAVEPQFRQLAKVLFDRGTSNADAVGASLGLDRSELNRIRKFESAYVAGRYAFVHFNSQLPEIFPENWLADNPAIVRKYIVDVNKAQVGMNAALRRQKPKPYTFGDIMEDVYESAMFYNAIMAQDTPENMV